MAEEARTSEMETEPAPQEPQNVMTRVSNLPLVSSACDVVSSAYSSTKDSMPVLKGVMEAAETGVRTLGEVASTGTRPILAKLEPQISMVSEYAMKGLDKMEEKLPILHEPADKVVSEAVDKVYHSVTGMKDAMVEAVMGGVDMTRTAVSGGIGSVMGTSVGQKVTSGVGLALKRSADWVDQNLPLTEKELAAVSEPLPDEEGGSALSSTHSYFVRLGKLSTRVRERALEQSLVKVRSARDATHNAVAQITSTLDLLETTNQLGGAPEQLMRRWKEWKNGQPSDGEGQGAEDLEVDGAKDQGQQLELRALSMVRGLSEQVRTAFAGVVSSAQGLPGAVQEQLKSGRHAAEELHASLGSASTLTPLLLQHSRQQITQVRQSLDSVVEYLLNNTPLTWLVGPFSPQRTESVLTTE